MSSMQWALMGVGLVIYGACVLVIYLGSGKRRQRGRGYVACLGCWTYHQGKACPRCKGT